MDLIHAGRGLTDSLKDSLYLFKKKFGQNSNFQLHIGKDMECGDLQTAGTFGNAVMARFNLTDVKEIRIFSRGEKKQNDLRKV